MLLSRWEIEIKKSKFIGLLYDIKSEEQVKDILTNIKKEYAKARHYPFSYILNNTARKTDDKEPHNTAGIQLYNLLNMNNLNHHLLIVVRFFGGTKLGASNLLRAYNTCGKNTIAAAKKAN